MDDNGAKVFRQEPAVHLPLRGSCVSEYSTPRPGLERGSSNGHRRKKSSVLLREETDGSSEEEFLDGDGTWDTYYEAGEVVADLSSSEDYHYDEDNDDDEDQEEGGEQEGVRRSEIIRNRKRGRSSLDSVKVMAIGSLKKRGCR